MRNICDDTLRFPVFLSSLGPALGALLIAGSASAQGCNPSGTPAPPPVNIPNVNGQTFGPAPAATFLIDLRGAPGCPGAENNGSGGDGDPGQPGAAATALDMQNVTTVGASVGYVDPVTNGGIGAPFVAYGGTGGTGGQSDYWSFPDTQGGNGGAAGGAGGFTGSLRNFTVQGTSGAALTYGLYFLATGGAGGTGGWASRTLYPSQGGTATAGAAGGTVYLSSVLTTIGAGGGGPAPKTGAALIANGGAGGAGGSTAYNVASTWAGAAGAGGAGGKSQAAMVAGTSIGATITGLAISANGGDGGPGGQSGTSGGETHGGAGGAGGTGGLATLSFDGAIAVGGDTSGASLTGILVQANGGQGGNGGLAGGALGGTGGAGGAGGNGGSAVFVLLGSVDVKGQAGLNATGRGVLVQGNGGFGGYGSQNNAAFGYGGNGGTAGNGTQIALTLGDASASGPSKVTTEGVHIPAIVAQSIGGAGGAGGAAQWWATGGAGANGGNGGGVGVISNQNWAITSGDFSRALVAQSIGGGGGVGGNSTDINVGAGYSVGGNGGRGGDGSWVELKLNGGTNNVFASTSEKGGGGVLAQSIGGAGGAGGNASEKGFGIFTMVVGGDSGAGGAAGPVDINSAGIVTTLGDHAVGLRAQSIGGGGGVAGVAIGTEAGLLPTAAVAVGGGGGSGGTGNTVTIENAGQVTTYGPDAFGIEGQSIGGGGGSGGSATATAIDFAPSDDVPAVSVSYAAGGKGGSGNTGGAVTIDNSGFVITAGHGAMAIKAQSVGGGGGHAGDASAASWTGTKSSDANVSVNLSLAIGGSGGVGGTGGAVKIDNSGLLYTTGQDAHAVLAQSVGGGGGTGGIGDTSATAVVDDLSMSIGMSIGGKGGTGGHGGDVTLTNEGAAVISTRGDGSDAVFAQSVGGGGGAGGGGSASTSGGKISLAFAVGGSGGAGGDGGDVTLSNAGLLATTGTNSMGLTAQSVGGGGGRGGKAGATAGGADDDLPLFVGDQIADAFGLSDAPSTQIYNDIFMLNDRLKSDVDTVEKLVNHFSGKAPAPGESDDISLSIAAALSMGGSGGAAGQGGDITLNNTGDILTQGAQADGVIGQSVGGGGGIAGYSVASGASSDDTSPNFAVSMGGSGGGGGAGGAVTVTSSGTVSTAGTSAYGLVAQSVGAGGGVGGASQDTNNGAFGFGVSLGGGGGSAGDGGKVDVELKPGATVVTSGKFGLGILAQSVGGGGGLIRTMTTDQQGDQSGSDDSDDPDTHNIFLDVGVAGASGPNGSGGTVNVALDSGVAIGTTGYKAHGVVASSLGGGGGAVGGGIINLIDAAPSTGGSTGNGGAVTIALSQAIIETQGTGAVGLWGSSIGGTGGVLLGDLKQDSPIITPGIVPGENNVGNGGPVTITLDRTNLTTLDGPAIVAHSIGGSGYSAADGGDKSAAGGWTSPMTATNLGGAGTSGVVSVAVTDSIVSAGDQSAIVAGSDALTAANIAPGAANPITVTVTKSQIPTTEVSNNSADHATISVINKSDRDALLTNSGIIANLHAGGAAAASLFGGRLKVVNSGTLTGNIIGGDGTSLANRAGATFAPYDTVNLGATGSLSNAGTIEVGGAGRIHATTLVGNFTQTASGRLRFGLDSAGGEVDHLHVTGTATLDGGFEFAPDSLLPGAHEVLSADGGVVLTEDPEPASTQIFTFTPSIEGGRLTLSTEADFLAGADTADRRSIGRVLQRGWDAGGGGFGEGFAALAGVADADSYQTSLDRLSGQSVAAVGYARYLGGQSFAQSTYSCPRFEDASVFKTQDSCGWLRVGGSWLERRASGDDPAFDLNTVTTSIGGQKRIGDDLFLGGALGWETANLSDDADGTQVEGDALVGALSLKKVMGPWTLTGAFDFGSGSYDSTRTIVIGTTVETATASPDASNLGLHARAAYQIPRGTWYAEPAFDLDLSYVKLDGYDETGGGDFALGVDQTDTTVLTGTPWLKVGRRVNLEGGQILDAYVAGGASLSAGEDFDVTAHFLATPEAGSFQTTLDNPGFVGRVTAGLELYASDRLHVRVQYDGGFANDQTTNGAQFRLSYLF